MAGGLKVKNLLQRRWLLEAVAGQTKRDFRWMDTMWCISWFCQACAVSPKKTIKK